MHRALPAIVASLTLVLAGCGDDPLANEANVVVPVETPTPANATEPPPPPREAPSDRVTLDGTVISTTANRLLLDYGTGELTVEMIDWPSFREGSLISPGDRVIVTGVVDEGFLTKRTLVARSIYVTKLNTAFFADGAEAEDFGLGRIERAEGAGHVTYKGSIRSIEGRVVQLGTNEAALPVDVSQLADDPLDDQGAPALVPGDRIYVWGEFQPGSGDGVNLVADGLVRLKEDAHPVETDAVKEAVEADATP